MTGVAHDKLANQKPDNCRPGYCYCVVSPSLCSIKLMSPLLCNVWPRKKNKIKIHRVSSQPRRFHRFGKIWSRQRIRDCGAGKGSLQKKKKKCDKCHTGLWPGQTWNVKVKTRPWDRVCNGLAYPPPPTTHQTTFFELKNANQGQVKFKIS